MRYTKEKNSSMTDKKILFEYQDYYIDNCKKYGENTAILMQVGGFYECYGVETDADVDGWGNVRDIAKITFMHVSGKSYSHNGKEKKHQMLGFPTHADEKYIRILVDNNYTVVIIDQDAMGIKNPKRAITRIISPGTNIDYTSSDEGSYTLGIFIEQISENTIYFGTSVVDVSTGENTVFESYSQKDDKNFGMDEIYRFIQIHNPKEIVIFIHKYIDSLDYLLQYLETGNSITHVVREVNHSYLKPEYQEEFIKKVFKPNNQLSSISYIGLDRYPFALNSYILTLNFLYDHDEQIIQKIQLPKISGASDELILTNDAIHQLNLVADKNNTLKTKNDSVIGLLNYTSTSIGKRYLRHILLNPITNKQELSNRYDNIGKLMNKQLGYRYEKYEENLKYISDIERLHRKLYLKKLTPYHFVSLDLSYTYLLKLIILANEDNLTVDSLNYQEVSNFIESYHQIVDVDIMSKIYKEDIKCSFFKEGVYPEIDKVQSMIDSCNLFFSTISSNLSALIEGDNARNGPFIKVEYNDNDGYFLATTKARCKLLKERLGSGSCEFTVNGKTYKIGFNDLEIKDKTSTAKIFSYDIKQKSTILCNQTDIIKNMVTQKYNQLLDKIYIENKELLNNMVQFIKHCDICKSNAKCAIKFNYKRPIIDESNHSFCEIKDLRHPIIEQISQSAYVPNDITLGKDNKNGMLLFGVNAVGKSSLMKSVGIAVIMAQAGMYVPCSYMKYSPYEYVFTRILNNDNIFKGMSSFAVEMSEMRNILKRANTNSLILGDELCSGTESISAQSIVAAGVITLAKLNSSFIFATHLHHLSKMDRIKQLENVDFYHLRVLYDEKTKVLTYDRKLEMGSGNPIYGLEVCKAMNLPDEFIELANDIRKEVMGIEPEFVASKGSNYNTKVFVDDCGICGEKAIDTHHIKFQSEADEHGMIGNMHKNNASNLVGLCKVCHDKVHNGNLVINGYLDTSEGKKLDYYYDEKVEVVQKKGKYSDEQISLIKKLGDEVSNKKYLLSKLNNEHSIDISYGTLLKILKK